MEYEENTLETLMVDSDLIIEIDLIHIQNNELNLLGNDLTTL